MKTKTNDYTNYVYERLKTRLKERDAQMVRLEVKRAVWRRFRAAQSLSGAKLFEFVNATLDQKAGEILRKKS